MAFVTELAGLDDEVDRKLLFGEPLDPVPKLVVTATTPGRFYDQLGAFTGILLVSSRLRRVLEEAPGARVQFIPVKVRGKSELGYFLANVLDTVPFLDPKRSKVKRYTGTDVIAGISRIVPRLLPGDAPPIFHIAEARPIFVVRDDLKRRLEAASDHPGTFIPVEKYRL